jgi:hypothetical protein
MGLINLDPTLHEGERVVWRRPAAHSLSGRVVAGVLYLTSEALLFMPNRFNRRRDIVSTRLPRELIARVDTVGPGVSLAASRSGGLRRRLRVTAAAESVTAAAESMSAAAEGMTAAAEVHVFVINHAERAATELTTALRGSPEPT